MTPFERARAFWTAKVAAVELGCPFEGWSGTDIARRHGPVETFQRDLSGGFGGDDDTTMPLALLAAWEAYGIDALAGEISKEWGRKLPLTWFWAFRRRQLVGFRPPATGRGTEHRGEHVGVMLMADLCGVVSPGDPLAAQRRAAEMGVVCGFGEGVAAGEVAAAAAAQIASGMSAASAIEACRGMTFLTKDPGRVPALVEGILKLDRIEDVVPWTIQFCQEPRLAETILPGSLGRPEPWVHCLPNLAIVLAVWRWKGESSWQAARAAVEMGWDTDSNAGVAASPLAVRDGLSSWPEALLAQLGSKIPSPLKGEENLSLEAAANRLAQFLR
jgi:hypothetical protein